MALIPKLPDNVEDKEQLLEFLRGVSQVLNDADNNTNNLSSTISNLSNLNTSSYSKYYVGEEPASPEYGCLWYNTQSNELQKYNGTSWNKIDWQKIIQVTPEWQAGKLRIGSDGVLEITPNSGSNWYDCYPVVGSNTIYITDLNKKYYLLPGNSAYIPMSTKIPIVAINDMSFRAMMYESGVGSYYWGLKFSGSLSSGLTTSVFRVDSVFGGEMYDYQMLTLGYSDSTNIGYSLADVTMYLWSDRIIAVSRAQMYHTVYGVMAVSSVQTKASTSYWLGEFTIHTYNGTPSAITLITRLT